VESLQPIGDAFPHAATNNQPATQAVEAHALATVVDDTVVMWNLDLDAWPEIACRAAGRNMTAAEWEEFGPQDEPYRATCPQWPALG
jgi:hypothetical protein